MALEEDVNKALVVAGNKSKYQFIVMLLLCVIFYFDVFLLLGPSFYFMDPTFICDGSDEVVDEKQACPRIAECRITNDFTITKYMGLYCDRQAQRDIIQSSLSIGSLIGLVLMNFISDLRGRRLALIADLIIGTLSALLTILGAYSQQTALLTVASVMAGFSGYSLVIVSYIIAGDICQQQMRQKSSLYMNCSYSLGLITFFFIYNWINQWYNILFLFMFFPFLALAFICFILIQQSPNYYLCKKKDKRKCIDSLTNIAIYNQKSDQEIGQIQKIIMNADFGQSAKQNQKQQKSQSVWSVLKQWRFLKIIIFMAIVESGGNLFFYGIQYAIDDIGFNYGVDNLVLGTAQIATTLVLTHYVSKLNRRKTLAISYISTVVVAFAFVFNFVQKSNVICTILIILIRALTTTGYFMIVMIQTESFPLQIHSIGAGSIEAFAQLGSFSAPLLITFAVNQGFEKMATMGVVLILCLIPLKFVPEPKGHHIQKQQLQQTLLQSQLQSPNQ